MAKKTIAGLEKEIERLSLDLAHSLRDQNETLAENKTLKKESGENDRLHRKIDSIKTAVSSRLATVRPVFHNKGTSLHSWAVAGTATSAPVELSDEQKFLEYLQAELLSGQHIPDNPNPFY